MHWIRRAASRADWTAGRSRRDEDGDDGDDDQQLDQGERGLSISMVSHPGGFPATCVLEGRKDAGEDARDPRAADPVDAGRRCPATAGPSAAVHLDEPGEWPRSVLARPLEGEHQEGHEAGAEDAERAEPREAVFES